MARVLTGDGGGHSLEHNYSLGEGLGAAGDDRAIYPHMTVQVKTIHLFFPL